MPVSPFDDPGKSHPFINLETETNLKSFRSFSIICRSFYLINDVKVKLNSALHMPVNTHFFISGFTPTVWQSAVKSAVSRP